MMHLRENSGCNIKSTQYAQEEPSSWAIRSPPSLESAKMSSTVAITLSTISNLFTRWTKPPIPQLRPRCKPVAVKEGNQSQHPKGINADPSTSTETKAKAKKVKRLVNLGWKPGQKGDASGERSRNTYIHTYKNESTRWWNRYMNNLIVNPKARDATSALSRIKADAGRQSNQTKADCKIPNPNMEELGIEQLPSSSSLNVIHGVLSKMRERDPSVDECANWRLRTRNDS